MTTLFLHHFWKFCLRKVLYLKLLTFSRYQIMHENKIFQDIILSLQYIIGKWGEKTMVFSLRINLSAPSEDTFENSTLDTFVSTLLPPASYQYPPYRLCQGLFNLSRLLWLANSLPTDTTYFTTKTTPFFLCSPALSEFGQSSNSSIIFCPQINGKLLPIFPQLRYGD